MGWNQTLFESALHTSRNIFYSGFIFQKYNTQIQRAALASLSGNDSLANYTNTTTIVDSLTNLTLPTSFPDDFMGTTQPVTRFGTHLLTYNLCYLNQVQAVEDIADLCMNLGQTNSHQKKLYPNKIGEISSESVDSFTAPEENGLIPFPDPNNTSSTGEASLTLSTLVTLVKNRLLENIEIIQSSTFLAIDAATLLKYMKNSLAISNWLYVWSSLTNAIVVSLPAPKLAQNGKRDPEKSLLAHPHAAHVGLHGTRGGGRLGRGDAEASSTQEKDAERVPADSEAVCPKV
jgi:hypothetical protein